MKAKILIKKVLTFLLGFFPVRTKTFKEFILKVRKEGLSSVVILQYVRPIVVWPIVNSTNLDCLEPPVDIQTESFGISLKAQRPDGRKIIFKRCFLTRHQINGHFCEETDCDKKMLSHFEKEYKKTICKFIPNAKVIIE